MSKLYWFKNHLQIIRKEVGTESIIRIGDKSLNLWLILLSFWTLNVENLYQGRLLQNKRINNMRKLLIFICLLFSFYSSYSQDHKIDSLETILSQKIKDSERLEVLIELGKEYMKKNVASLDSIALEVKQLANKLNSDNGLAHAYFYKAFYQQIKLRKYDVSQALLDTTIIYMPAVKDYEFHGLVYIYKGLNAQVLNDYDSAILYFNKAENEFKLLDDKNLYISAIANTANVLRDQNKYVEAIETYLKGLKEVEGTDEYLSAKIYSNMATTYKRMDDETNAIENYEKAYSIYQKIGNETDQATLLLNSARLYPLDLAIEKLIQAKDIFEKKQYNNSLGKVLNQLGLCYKNKEEYPQAIHYFKESISLKKEKSKTSSLLNLADIYYTVGNYSKAKEYTNQANEIVLKYNYTRRLPNVYLLYSWIEEKEGNGIKALSFYKKYHSIQDSLLGIEKEKAIIELETKYQTEKKEQENLLLKKEKRNQQLKTYAAIALSLLAATITLLLFWQSRIRKKANTQLQQKNQEILHRTKNNLTMLSVFMKQEARRLENEEAKAAVMEAENRLQTIAMIDQKLNQQNNQAININEYLSELTDNLKNTFTKNGENVQLNVGIEDMNLDAEHAAWIGLIVNELMTNSFKYAFAEKDNPQIEIVLRKKANNQIDMTYRDNGIGLPNEVNIKNAKSFGQRLIRNLTEQMDGTIQTKNDNGLVYQFLFQTPKLIS